jgi:23S rRNA G2069 N7-methylase RlmK/C1962 C5-methylase RlmI
MPLPVVRLLKGKARPFWHGCPVVFSGAVAAVAGAPGPGAWVEVRDDADRPIGQGFYNPDSTYRVRILRLAREADVPDDPDGCVAARLVQAAALRRALGLPGPDTDCLRLANSEGDRLSGLTVDVFGDVAVAQASARWALERRDAVDAAIRAALGRDVGIVHRAAPILREEGVTGPVATAGAEGGMPAPFAVRESGLSYALDPSRGQKTGFYLDQRDNRMLVRSLARGRRVLDLFCFSGGFALNAARGGATEVLGVDSSAPAIAAAQANARANGLDGAVRFQASDVAAVLGQGGTWDLVVCDPPKYAARRADLDAAFQRYLALNRAAMMAVAPGGVLVTCSCSAAVHRDPFLEMLREAAAQAGRRLSVTHVQGAAPDHPVDPAWPDGAYLKCVVAFVG